MLYNVLSEEWDWMTTATLSEQQEDFRIRQDAIFDDLDDTYIRKYGRAYFN